MEVEMINQQNKNPFKAILDEYSGHVLSGDKISAIKLIMEITKSNTIEVKDIYKYILQPFQIELGRLWHENNISVAQEHYGTAISQFAMSTLYEKIFLTAKNNKVFLGTCVQGELHELGIRMVCDYMECSGWNTYYLGANTPNSAIIQMIHEKKPDIVCISCTMPFNISEVKYLITDIKNSGIITPVIVGGYAFNMQKESWVNSGADGYSESFEEALLLSEKLCIGGSL